MKENYRHENIPFYRNCLDFVSRKPAPFYSPGHKGGKTLPEKLKAHMAEIDLNNLAGTDTLHCPSGSILEAEELLSEAYGVIKSFMLVGGSTLGNMASVMAVAGPREKILVQRNAHKSIIAALVHSGASPVWLSPLFDSHFSIAHGVNVQQLEEAFARHPDAKGVVLLHPTYFGTVADMVRLTEITKRYGKVLIADEAHGAHFHFHPDLPIAAEDAGADLVVQSIHKTLSALSQGAVLHLNSEKIAETKLRKILQSLQTTSPFFPILASIDWARHQMVLEGQERLEVLLSSVREVRERIRRIRGLKLLTQEEARGAGSGFYSLDETKIVVDCQEWGLSGYELLHILNDEYAIVPELAGPHYVLFIVSIGNTREELDRLASALKDVGNKRSLFLGNRIRSLAVLNPAAIAGLVPHVAMLPRDAFFAPSERCPLADSVNRICSEVLTPYPPGIPILMPGETISVELVEFLLAIKAMKLPVSASDPTFETIEVVVGV